MFGQQRQALSAALSATCIRLAEYLRSSVSAAASSPVLTPSTAPAAKLRRSLSTLAAGISVRSASAPEINFAGISTNAVPPAASSAKMLQEPSITAPASIPAHPKNRYPTARVMRPYLLRKQLVTAASAITPTPGMFVPPEMHRPQTAGIPRTAPCTPLRSVAASSRNPASSLPTLQNGSSSPPRLMKAMPAATAPRAQSPGSEISNPRTDARS